MIINIEIRLATYTELLESSKIVYDYLNFLHRSTLVHKYILFDTINMVDISKLVIRYYEKFLSDFPSKLGSHLLLMNQFLVFYGLLSNDR